MRNLDKKKADLISGSAFFIDLLTTYSVGEEAQSAVFCM